MACKTGVAPAVVSTGGGDADMTARHHTGRSASISARAVTPPAILRDRIAQDVRSDVLCARIHPGARLSELELAKRFGVSRGPIREALSQLIREGLLISKPNCGVTVAPPPRREVRGLILPIRRTVECYALTQCFDQLDSRDFSEWNDIVKRMQTVCHSDNIEELVALDLAFHRAIIARTGQSEVLALWQAVVSQIRGHFAEKFLRHADKLEIFVKRHRELVEVFREGDREAAVAALKKHIS